MAETFLKLNIRRVSTTLKAVLKIKFSLSDAHAVKGQEPLTGHGRLL